MYAPDLKITGPQTNDPRNLTITTNNNTPL